jgi:hypothetical protein
MSHGYRDKRTGKLVPEGEERVRRAQAVQRMHCEATAAAAEAFRLQDMPVVEMEDGEAFCPYAACRMRQRYLTIGVHTCTATWCDRDFKVPDNDRTRRIAKKWHRKPYYNNHRSFRPW